jgi:hypothetical protein
MIPPLASLKKILHEHQEDFHSCLMILINPYLDYSHLY